MKRLLYYAVFGAFLLAMMYGCEKKVIDFGTTDKPILSNTQVKFSTDIQPIFNSKCLACHGTGGQSPVLDASVSYNDLTGGGYINTSNPPASLLYVQVTTVHDGKCTEPEEELILTWIQQGAQNN
jgi:hypothetical protein